MKNVNIINQKGDTMKQSIVYKKISCLQIRKEKLIDYAKNHKVYFDEHGKQELKHLDNEIKKLKGLIT